MSPTRSADKLLLCFRPTDSRFGVARATVKRLAEQLDLSEAQLIHFALKRLATEMLPTYAYEPDGSPLTSQELRTIAKIAGGCRGQSVRSALFL